MSTETEGKFISTFKTAVPAIAPKHCAIIYSTALMMVTFPVTSAPQVTAGFK